MGTSCKKMHIRKKIRKKIHIRKKIRKKIHKKIQEDTINDPVSTRVGFVVCQEPGRISLYVALPPSRPQPIGSRKQLEPRSRSAVHRDENFVS